MLSLYVMSSNEGLPDLGNGLTVNMINSRHHDFHRNLFLRNFCKFILLFPLLLSGCGEKSGARNEDALQGTSRSSQSLIDLGDEVMPEKGVTNMFSAASQAYESDISISNSTGGRWSVILGTTAGSGHELEAARLLKTIQRDFPELEMAFMRSNEKGSTVWFGTFDAPDDPSAISTRTRIQSLQTNGRPAFPRAFMGILPDVSPMGNFDLRRARLMNPNINPLYTLQVACWGTFGSNEISWSEVKSSAEKYAMELRRKGFDAWYYHDRVTSLSVVTVGIFDRRAYNAQTTLFSPEVEMLKNDFPVHRINGDDAMVEIRPGDSTTRVPQECRLVAVPDVQ